MKFWIVAKNLRKNNMNKLKRLEWNGCPIIKIPFMLTSFSSWEEQVDDEIEKIENTYLIPKKAKISFCIENRNNAEIIISKE